MRHTAGRVVAGVMLAIAVLVPTAPALALNPRLDISQYGHTAWRVSDGFPAALITDIVQTPDGYLWLGTDDGLFRFDGIKATPWRPPSGQPLPSNRIRSLVATRDGTLWISTEKGVVSWRNGGLTFYRAPEETYNPGSILADRDGVVWGLVYLPRLNRRVLCAFRGVEAECHGQDGGPGSGSYGLFEDSKGQLWVGAAGGVWRFAPAPARFYPMQTELDAIQALAEDAGGALLISRRGGVDRLADGRVETKHQFPPAMKELRFSEMLKDRDGALWLSGSSDGLLHVHQGVTDTFGEIDGLASDSVRTVFEDREGNVWVGTAGGLHRFRDVAVAAVTTRQGLPSPRANAFMASPDGAVWISTRGSLIKAHENEVIVYRERASISAGDESRVFRGIRYVPGVGIPGTAPHAIFRDGRGRIWVATELGVGHLDHDRFVKANGVPGGITRGVAEDGDGTIWVVNQDRGLFSLTQGRGVAEARTWAALGIKRLPTAVAGDPHRGVWVGFLQGGVVHIDGGVRAAYGQEDGLPPGRVSDLRFDHAGALWIATEGGLTRVKAGRLATLNAAGGLPCDHAQWALTDDAGSLWLAMTCGLVRVSSADLGAWEAAADRQDTNRRVRATVFGTESGFRSAAGVAYSRPVAKSTDGRLWFLNSVGVGVLDPGSLPFNREPPPVHIETVTVDRRTHDAGSSAAVLRLPPLTRDLQIDYTALSFVAPESNRFRYRLEGRDTDWQDAGTRRQAFYSDLSPGEYRFRVIASNNDGVWNETGASVGFAIAPAYYQTTWFLALVAGMLLTLVWSAHRLRLRIVETHEREISALNEKLMSAQEQERIRIAGELHDGVMQEMLAATMMLGAAKRRIDGNPAEAQATIDKVQQKLVQAGTDIRQLSHDLHPPALQDAGLPDALRSHCEQFSVGCGIPITCDADDRVHDLSRGAALALFRIVQEALGNAAKHAQATRITVGLTRSGDDVTLTIADNGIGFDRGRLTTSGGLGLITMRERAGQLNGRFEFNTTPGRGTTITVVIPFR